MGTKTKTFDCVRMKARIQERIMDEYEAEKDRYPSFVEFIKARNKRSDTVHAIRQHLRSSSARSS